MPDHFEAKLHGFRRTMDGVVISYVIHPEDVSPALALATLGTRYMVAFEAIGDDEKATPTPGPQAAGGHARAEALSPERRSEIAALAAAARWKPRKQFTSLPLYQQAAIRSTDEKFWEWINVTGENAAADYIREHCKVSSRREITENEKSGLRWAELERQFKAHLTDERYGDLAR